MVVLSRLAPVIARRAAIIVAAILVPALSFGLFLELLPAALEQARYLLLAPHHRGGRPGHRRRAAGQRAARRDHLGAQHPLAGARRSSSPSRAVRGVADVLRTRAPPARRPGRRRSRPRRRQPGRDIYHLILDRYGSERAFRTGYGIDNSEFIAWLREQGFQVLDDAHANYTLDDCSRWPRRWACRTSMTSPQPPVPGAAT